ncbi:STAS domain-containing protein [Streptomyces sp. NPDC059063]|uniref:STAS domain-containing protein n=1 Tax=unclassified Streptomyces TaxID=2593676 RepID=UPI00367FF93A
MALYGDVDLLAAPAVTAHLDTLTAGPYPDLILDLRAVTFIDCAGLGLLCRAHNRALERHGRLRLVADGTRFLRILRHAGLARLFDVQPQLPAPTAPPQHLPDAAVCGGR